MYLFVYGTLRLQSGHTMHAILADNACYCGPARIQGKLFMVSDYPGLILSSDSRDSVTGEIYQLTGESILSVIDDYEECADQFPLPHEYRRQLCQVQSERSGLIEAWVYLYNLATDQLHPVNSGDFLNR